MPFNKLPHDLDLTNKSHIADLHNALVALKLVPKTEAPAKTLVGPINDAIKVFKKENALGTSESLTPATIDGINLALHDNFVVSNKTRVNNLHGMLEKIGIPVDKNEKTKRTVGAGTRDAIISFQKENNLPQDGKISDELMHKLDAAFIEKTFSAKVQVVSMQKDLLTIRRIAKMPDRIDEAELKNKEIGPSTKTFIKNFQTKYKLNATGNLDRPTLDKIKSVVASRGIRAKELKKANASNLKSVKKQLRLNMTDKNMPNVHQALVHLGFPISENETKLLKFGKSTQKAVLAFQKTKGLPLTGHIEGKTLKLLNSEILRINPSATEDLKYRIRGSVRNDMWDRKNNMSLKIFEKTVEGKSASPLMTKKNMLNGFFDITYPPPLDKRTGQVSASFDLVIELYESKDSKPANDVFIQSKTCNKVGRIQWVNFTMGTDKYQGDAEFTVLVAALNKALGSVKLENITERAQNRQVTQLSNQTGISTDEIMRLLLSCKISISINNPDLTDEVFYAFLGQYLPADLPGDLFIPVSVDWNMVNTLMENAESGIGFLDADMQVRVIETAIAENLVSRKVYGNKAKVLQGLADLQIQFSLAKKILVGNGNISTLISNSTLDVAHAPVVAKAFMASKGFDEKFWQSLQTDPALAGDQVRDLKLTVDLGGLTKNFEPVLKTLKNDIGAGKRFAAIGSIAKLSTAELQQYIVDNGGHVPDGFATPADYAITLKQRSEAMFPAIALVADLKKSAANPLQHIDNVEAFFDANTDFNIHTDTVDIYTQSKGIVLDKAVKTDIKTTVRVRKLTDNAATATTLLENKLHTSRQVYFMGKERLAALGGTIDSTAASRIYEKAKLQYAQVLGKLTNFKPELNLGTPAAIVSQTYTTEELKTWLGDIPDLELLFGNMDFCECEHCRSLYGPSAYLVDVLRFLKQHIAVDPAKTVKDILFERRPDIGNIKLNCANTDTPIPYIDLVCEVLENTIQPLALNANFDFQTTLTRDELRAMPQNVRKEAYDLLAIADFPMSSSFDLNRAETRTYLNFLGIPRYKLMETFRNITDPGNKIPDDLAIAAEYLRISKHEIEIITTAKPTKADQEIYWGFDASKDAIWLNIAAPNTEVSVATFMKRTQLEYTEVLKLLLVEFVNPAGANESKIIRPVDSCSTDEQKISNITFEKLDRMHRFLRLWRKSGWEMWELDLLLRAGKLGANNLNADAINKLKIFKELQEKMSLPVEVMLVFYGDINTTSRINAEKPEVQIPSLYESLFQNSVITKPIDAYFKLPLDNSIKLGLNPAQLPLFPADYSPIPTILSALSVRQSEINKIMDKTDGHLSIASLSVLLRYTWLARSLKLQTEDLIALIGINGLDPFSNPQATSDFILSLEYIHKSSLSISELEYILNYKPDSSIEWRTEVYDQHITTLKQTLQLNRDSVDKLQLTDIQQSSITGFDTAALALLADNQLIPGIAPLVTILTDAKESLDAAKFADDERSVILDFASLAVSAARKQKLIDSIKVLQTDLSNLLNQDTVQIQSFVSSVFSLEEKSSADLLQLKLPAPNTKTLMEILTDKAILQDNPDTTQQTLCLMLLHKLSLLIQKMWIDEKNLQWLIAHFDKVSTIDFAALPVKVLAGTNQYTQWLNLVKFYNFKNSYPEPETASIRTILDKAIAADTLDNLNLEINRLTQWDTANSTNLKDLAAKLTLKVGDYLLADTYERLQKCIDMIRIAGVDAVTIFNWNDLALELSSIQTRLAIKAKYANDDWLSKITPLQDDIREKKRDALVAYFLEYSQHTQDPFIAGVPNQLYWKDANMLFKHFLIDVEMSACQLTSRIKQCISSVQLFVQRCFLNLENRFVTVSQDQKQDVSSPNAWSQWKWMKNYRVWEANRKVFFYPENWILPELRDDKSDFFVDLENEINQNEITHENAENAFLNYLHKLDDVAHLDVCGLFHEQEDEDTTLAGYERDIIHVVGRTKTIPHIYYYRQYDNNYSTWTAYEKIDLDIAGENLVPVVYNRKLHLFWLVMQQKPIKVHKIPSAQASSGSNKTQDSQDPAKYWEIQLAWAIRKHNGWSTKKISKEKLIHPWERPLYSYHLKPYYFQKLDQLYLDLYNSTSPEFNDTLFYDQLTGDKHRMTANPYDETFLPWHSSSFIFDGDVTDIKLKNYRNSFSTLKTEFKDESNGIELMDVKEFGPRLRLPSGMHMRYNRISNNRQTLNANQLNVISSSSTSNLLAGALYPFEAVVTQQDKQFDFSQHALFYQDMQKAYFIKPEFTRIFNSYNQYVRDLKQYRFLPFYHPYTKLFIRELNRKGLDGLMDRNVQLTPQSYPPQNTFDFSSYKPTSDVIVDPTSQNDSVDFSLGGAFSIYNWELFFHAPLMIACKLMQNQRFEEAMGWFHYIMNPTNIEPLPTPQRYWITKPFFNYNAADYRKQRIENILKNIDSAENQAELKVWKNNPFKPHLIARYRPVAYQKTVVMKYIDNLIAWGDMLFRRDTIEAINEASLLYMLAYELLGDRPIKVPNLNHEDKSFNEIEASLDDFGNASIDVLLEDTVLPIQVVPSSNGTEPLPKLDSFYFCIPNNENILAYWDTVEDRLFKIRRCMNIEGVVRQLPLFEPPIDPALLVKAAAAGIDINSLLNDLSAGTPNYRFKTVTQKAIEFCADVKVLGDKLINVIEKKDIESLALLRTQHELQLLKAVREIRTKQIDEAVEVIGGLNKALDIASQKYDYYNNLVKQSDLETSSLTKLGDSIKKIDGNITEEVTIGWLNAIPTFNVGISGFGGSPNVGISLGATIVTSVMNGYVSSANSSSSKFSQESQKLNTQASYDRRKQEWDFQAGLASVEKDQVQFQISAAEIRQAIAEKELDNQDLQIENAEEVEEYMKNKYSNAQLYNWMISQVSTIYFQAYQLAFDMAKKAERCYQYELGISNSNFIQPLYWDSLKKGLLSGDKLLQDLHRMEGAYIDNHNRELEIRKQISLSTMFPLQLVQLKETGKCNLILPEWMFNMDYPGHYFRRIKSVSISVPCIVGPYTSINCTLSLLKSTVRISPTGNQYAPTDENDTRFQTRMGAISSIATSHAQNDSGLFELNFNDERYLPFEGCGAISEWQIDLPKANNYFNYESLSEVVIQIYYTARNAGMPLAQKAMADLDTNLPKNIVRLFNLKHEFPNEWHQFVNTPAGTLPELSFTLKAEHYPFFVRGRIDTQKMKTADIWIEGTDNIVADMKITSGNLVADIQINKDAAFNNTPHKTSDLGSVDLLGENKITIKTPGTLDKIENIYFLLQS